MPRRGRVGGVIERKDRDNQQWQEQKDQKRGQVQRSRSPQPDGSWQCRNHVRRMTSLKRWPLSLRPSQTIAVDSASSRKPKAAPCSKLKSGRKNREIRLIKHSGIFSLLT